MSHVFPTGQIGQGTMGTTTEFRHFGLKDEGKVWIGYTACILEASANFHAGLRHRVFSRGDHRRGNATGENKSLRMLWTEKSFSTESCSLSRNGSQLVLSVPQPLKDHSAMPMRSAATSIWLPQHLSAPCLCSAARCKRHRAATQPLKLPFHPCLHDLKGAGQEMVP